MYAAPKPIADMTEIELDQEIERIKAELSEPLLDVIERNLLVGIKGRLARVQQGIKKGVIRGDSINRRLKRLRKDLDEIGLGREVTDPICIIRKNAIREINDIQNKITKGVL